MVDSIRIEGLTGTKKALVEREYRGITGASFSPDAIDAAVKGLRRYGFLEVLDPGRCEYDSRTGKSVIEVRLREADSRRFEGVMGYYPGRQGRKGRLIGRMDFDMANLFGMGRRLDARWESTGRSSELFRIGFADPWLLGRPVGGEFNLSQEERDDQGYVKTNINVSMDKMFSGVPEGKVFGKLSSSFLFKLGLGWETVTGDSMSLSKSVTGNFSAEMDTRNSLYNPGSGYKYSAGGIVGFWQNSETGEKDRLFSYDVDVEHYFPLRKRSVAAVIMHITEVRGTMDPIPLSHKVFVGGVRSVRGYSEDQFIGERVMWMKNEYRQVLGNRTRAFVFFDIGHYYDSYTTGGYTTVTGSPVIEGSSISKTIYGYGFGLAVAGKGGLIDVSLAWGRDDSPGDSKLHIRAVHSF